MSPARHCHQQLHGKPLPRVPVRFHDPLLQLILSLIRPSAPITTGIVVIFIPHILVISISRLLYFDNFSTSLMLFLSDRRVISIMNLVFWCLFLMRVMLAFISLSVFCCHVPKNCDVVVLCHCLRLLLVHLCAAGSLQCLHIFQWM